MTLNLQNHPKLGHRHLWLSLVSGGGAQRERLSVKQANEADWIVRTRDFKCAESSETQPPSYVPVTLIFGEEYKLWSSSLCNFHHSHISSPPFSVNTPFSILFSDTHNLCSSLNVTEKFTGEKIIVKCFCSGPSSVLLNCTSVVNGLYSVTSNITHSHNIFELQTVYSVHF
jgi:hypothetical protein